MLVNLYPHQITHFILHPDIPHKALEMANVLMSAIFCKLFPLIFLWSQYDRTWEVAVKSHFWQNSIEERLLYCITLFLSEFCDWKAVSY